MVAVNTVTCVCGAVRPAPITTPCTRCAGGNHGTPYVLPIIHNPRPGVVRDY